MENSYPEVELPGLGSLKPAYEDMLPLFIRIQNLAGIKLSKQILKELEVTPQKV